MDKRTVRDAIAQTLAANRAEIERLRPLHPGETDEQIAAHIWYARHMRNLDVDFARRKYELGEMFGEAMYDIQREALWAKADPLSQLAPADDAPNAPAGDDPR